MDVIIGIFILVISVTILSVLLEEVWDAIRSRPACTPGHCYCRNGCECMDAEEGP